MPTPETAPRKPPDLRLAEAVLAWDRQYPGAADRTMEVTGAQWAQLVNLARDVRARGSA